MQKIAILLCALSCSTLCKASELTLTATNAAWYDQSGHRNGFSDSYFTGYVDGGGGSFYHRSFVVFAIPTLASSDTITAARLEYFNPLHGYRSPDSSETLQIVDVVSSISRLLAAPDGATDVYSDLGSGAIYGERSVSDADSFSWLSVSLNPAAIGAITALQGGSIAFGAHLSSLSQNPPGTGGFIFGGSGGGAKPNLVLTTVPEPSISVLCVFVFGLGGKRFFHRESIIE